MTEEERLEWAKNFVQPVCKKGTIRSDTRMGKKKATIRIRDQIRKAKDYAKPEIRAKQYGEAYNERARFLYKHNPAYKANRDYINQMYFFRKRKYEYDAWIVKYYKEYKGQMIDKAQTFKLSDDNFVHGYTVKELIKYSPIKKGLLQAFFDSNILPEPTYKGKVFKAKKISDTEEPFYLVGEVEAYLNILARYRKKFGSVKTDEQKAFLKRQFWTELLRIRKEFDERT